MKLTINITDELYEDLKRVSGAKGSTEKATVNAHVKKLLTQYGTAGEHGRCFLVDHFDRLALEGIIQTTIADAEQLVKVVRQLSAVKLGIVERPLTDEEVARLAEQASFFGVSTEEHITNTLNECLDVMAGIRSL